MTQPQHRSLSQPCLAPLVITSGEPAGIGPDLCIQLAQQTLSSPVLVIADKHLLQQRAAQLGMTLSIRDYHPGQTLLCEPGCLSVLHLPLNRDCVAGQLDQENSGYVLTMLERAVQGCVSGEFSAMVTAPIHKGVINQAGIPFTGHTEFLAEKTDTDQVVMMLVSGEVPQSQQTAMSLRVALATTHLPLREVADAISADLLDSVLRIIDGDLRAYFGLKSPRILVAGLNPHAGEDGHMGREELDIMIPVLEGLRREGVDVSQPLPADTLFTPHKLAQADCVLAMYHDQGLPVLKHVSFGQGVNVTLGLPIIRTSVDHGTALELAGQGGAHVGSLVTAIRVAEKMAKSRV